MKGQLTVFFAMIMTTILSLAVALIDGARYSAMRLEIATVHQTAGNSVLAQYHRLLFERYGLLFFSTTDLGKKNMEFINYNFARDSLGLILGTRDLLSLRAEENQLESITLATDSAGMVLRRQCVECMEERYGISYLEQMAEMFYLVEEQGLLEEDLTYQICDEEWSEERIRADTEIFLQETMIPSSFHYLEKEALKFLLGKAQYSEKALDGESLASQRTLLKGDGLSTQKGFKNSQWDQLLFVEYILDYTGNYVTPLKDGYLLYQTEYILSGEEMDGVNLWNVVNQLLQIRTCANAIGILADENRNSLLGELSNSLAAALGNPEVEPVIYAALMILWAEIEGIYDVRNLLQGEGVSLLKANEDWLIDVSTIADLAVISDAREIDGEEKPLLGEGLQEEAEEDSALIDKGKMTYEDYLRLLLWFQDGETTAMRLMDVIESDIRELEDQSSFCLDMYADQFRVKTKVKSAYGQEFWITREYGY